jgi:propanediol dehydratase large subunit
MTRAQEETPPVDGFGRWRLLDRQRVNLDGLAREAPALGLSALRSPADPQPSLVIEDGLVVELDQRRREDFDVIDAFVADHGIDLAVAAEAMALDPVRVARMLVDPSVPRGRIVELTAGMTPAKLAAVVREIRPAELLVALTKMRCRRTPSNQAHVTNRLDDPLLLAADAATAVAYGFRELETTVPVAGDASSNAVALLIGSQVGSAGALTQCSVEESVELRLGVRGLVSYAETVSVYGTEQVFFDGDDTPWSKAFLVAAYASRGVKMRLSSGAGSEALMGSAEGRSMLYLESRCVSLARACGAQGVQNGGIDTAALTASVPGGVLELHYENLMVMMRGLESCSGNDSLMSESDMRRTSRTLPTLLAGSDFIVSGFGSIPRYDNMFGPSNLNAEDLDDYLVLQRDWGVDGGLRSPAEDQLLAVRRRAAEACRAVYAGLGLADFDDEHLEAVVHAEGSRDLPQDGGLTVLQAAQAISQQRVTGLDVALALDEAGYTVEAERVLSMLRARIEGNMLQPAAIFDEDMHCLSVVTDPNDYAGPGTGYVPTAARRAEIDAVRQERSLEDLRSAQMEDARPDALTVTGVASSSSDARDVVIAVSPGFGRSVWRTLSGLHVVDVLGDLLAGLEEEGCTARVVRINRSIDLGQIGLSGARLAGSGVGIGLLGKGTALIHRRDLPPLANLELYSVAPHITPEMYRLLATNAARHAKGAVPEPVRNPYSDEAITARYHTRVVAYVELERECCDHDASPELMQVTHD